MSGRHRGSYGTIVHEYDPESGHQRKHRTEPPADLSAKGIADFWQQVREHAEQHYEWEIEMRGGKWGQDDRLIYWADDTDFTMNRWWEN